MMIDPSVQAAVISSGGLILVAFLQIRGQQQQKRMHQKVEETHHQVTTNSHSSEKPTVIDLLDDVRRDLEQIHDWQKDHEKDHERDHRRLNSN